MWKKTALFVLLSPVFVSCTTTGSNSTSHVAIPDCSMSADDKAWIDRAATAWSMARGDIAAIAELDDFQAVFFDADCITTSSNALAGADGKATWNNAPHSGTITLPDGEVIPAGVTSFTSANDQHAFFVMSTPTVWRAGGVASGPLDLETLMIAVLLHEGSHVAQAQTYGLQVTRLQRENSLPESFGDDSLQERYADNEAFAASIARETELFFQAAAAADNATALRLAREARQLMLSRAEQWFTGDDTFWREGEDIWLTFEGSGQWVGYQWLISQRGAAVQESLAMAGFARRSRWWSQNEGLGIVLALDRLADPSWKQRAFGDGAQTILELLDAAIFAENVR